MKREEAARNSMRRRGWVPLAVLIAAVLPGCGMMGDIDAVKEADELAIACETEQALEAVDRAASGGGLGANLADLQRVVLLRDAGRMAEADAALADRNARANADAPAAEEAERSVEESLAELRAEREKRTGRPTCS